MTNEEYINFEAIQEYLQRQEPYTSEGVKIRRAAIHWFDELGQWDFLFDDGSKGGLYDQARSWRTKYNSAEDEKSTRKVIEEGLTSEEVMPDDSSQKYRPEIDADTGEFNPVDEPWIPVWFKPAAMLTAVGITTLAILRRIRLI